MGLLGLAMSPVRAALLLVPSLVTKLWQLFTGPRLGALLRGLWGMMIGVVVGLRKQRLRVPAAAEPRAGPLAGLVTGLVTGATGVFVVPTLPYLGSLALERETSFRRSTGARRWPRLAWRTSHGSHGYLVACTRAGARRHGAGRLAPRIGAAGHLPTWLLRQPPGAGANAC
jgi:hypothetical protein